MISFFVIASVVNACENDCLGLCERYHGDADCGRACGCGAELGYMNEKVELRWDNCTYEDVKNCKKEPDFYKCLDRMHCLHQLENQDLAEAIDKESLYLTKCSDCKFYYGEAYKKCVYYYCENTTAPKSSPHRSNLLLANISMVMIDPSSPDYLFLVSLVLLLSSLIPLSFFLVSKALSSLSKSSSEPTDLPYKILA